MADVQMSQKEYERRIDQVKKCGENRGPHDYIPVGFSRDEHTELATMLLCRVCFNRVSMKTLYENFTEFTI